MTDTLACEASERIRKRRDAIHRKLQESWISSQDSLPPDEEEDLADMLLVLSSAYGSELPRRVQLLCGVMSCLKDNALQDIAAVARSTILPTCEDSLDGGSLGEKVERKCSEQQDIISMLHSTTYNDETKSSGEPSDGVLSQKRRQHRDRNWEQEIEDAASLIESRPSCKAATIVNFMEVLSLNVHNWEQADEERHDGETPTEPLGAKVFDMAADDSLEIISQQVFSDAASPEKEKCCQSPTVYDMAHDDEEEILEELDAGSDEDSLQELILNTEQASVCHSEMLTGGKVQVSDDIQERWQPTEVAALADPTMSRTASPTISDSAACVASDNSSVDCQDTLEEHEGFESAKQNVYPQVVAATCEDLQLAGSNAAASEKAVPEGFLIQAEGPKPEAVAALEAAAPEAMAPGLSHIQDSSLESSHARENITDKSGDILKSRDIGDLMIAGPCEDISSVKCELPAKLELSQDSSAAAPKATADEAHASEADMLESAPATEIPCQVAALGAAEQSEPDCQGAAKRYTPSVAALVDHELKPDQVDASQAVMPDIVSEEKVAPQENSSMAAPEAATSEAAAPAPEAATSEAPEAATSEAPAPAPEAATSESSMAAPEADTSEAPAPAGDAPEAAMIEAAPEEKVASGAAALGTEEQSLSSFERAAWRHLSSVGTWHGDSRFKLKRVQKPDVFEEAPAELDQALRDETTPTTTADAIDSQTICDEATPTSADPVDSATEACQTAVVTTPCGIDQSIAAAKLDEHSSQPWPEQLRSNNSEDDEEIGGIAATGSMAAAKLAASVKEEKHDEHDEHGLQPWLLKLRQSSSKGSSVVPDVKRSEVDREFEDDEEDEEDDSTSDDEADTEEMEEDRQVRLRLAKESRERINELARELHSMLSSSAASSSSPMRHLGSKRDSYVSSPAKMVADTPHSKAECDQEVPLNSHRSSGMLRPSGAAALVRYLPCK